LVCSSPGRITVDSAILIPSRMVERRPDPGGIVNQLAVQRQSRPLLPELSELFSGLSAFSGFPTIAGIAGLRSFFDGNLMRLEDETKDGVYEVRAELPGVDPTDDIEVTVRDGQLTIKAERTQTSESNGHSEFSYGSFVRTVTLPAGADEDDINATYDRGILTVTVPLAEDQPAEKRVEVIETILVDEDEDFDDDEDDNFDDEDDGQTALDGAGHDEHQHEHEEQHQPAS
jgi:HSP20 family molecular chaperone IbpA